MIQQGEVDDTVSDIMKKHGAFFAFNNEQLSEGKDANLELSEYCNVGAGMLCPKKTADKCMFEINEAYEKHAQVVRERFSVAQIIKYELCNHEIDITGDITDTVDAVECYGITEQDVIDHCKKYKVSISQS